jgi:ATP-binding cassette subfamily B (MDR/TAP) protein 1
VQEGISEKVPLCLVYFSTFITGFVRKSMPHRVTLLTPLVAFARNWRLAFAISTILPCIAITVGIMVRFQVKYTELALKHIANGGTLAEEVISSIRTAQAFGTQNTLGAKFAKEIEQARVAAASAAIPAAFSLGTICTSP